MVVVVTSRDTQDRVRVLLCAPNLSRAGAERMSLLLLEGLDRQRFDVEMYVHERLPVQFDPDPRFQDDVIYGRVGEYNRRDLFHHLTQTIRRARRADVVVGVAEGRASGLALLAGLVARRPVVLWLHADWSRFAAVLSWRVKATMRAFRRAAAIVACSDGVAQSHAAAFPENRDLLRVITNGIDVAQVKARAAEPLPPEALALFARPTVVAVGRLNRQKGFDLLIAAHAKARQMGADHELVILGEGDERGALTELAAQLGVSASVHLLGFQENPYRFMARATLFASSSRFEGFGLVIAEALACKAPTVAFDCPSGPAEILDGGTYGALVPPQDVGAMAEAIAQLLGDPDRREALADSGPGRARAYDVAAFAQGWGRLLDEVAARRG